MTEADRYIMVTRPAQQAGELIQHIEAGGGRAFACPLLDIEPVEASPALCRLFQSLASTYMAIFISTNAVEHGFAALEHCKIALPATIKLAAVGQKTAAALTQLAHRSVDVVPDEYNSEGLLATEACKDIAGKQIMIFRGGQGRELLAETLRQRGASVDYAEVYARKLPTTSHDILNQHLKSQRLDVILITSGEALHNLLKITDNEYRTQLLATPLIVINQRLAEMATQLGFTQKPVLSHHASDDAMLSTLHKHGFLA